MHTGASAETQILAPQHMEELVTGIVNRWFYLKMAELR